MAHLQLDSNYAWASWDSSTAVDPWMIQFTATTQLAALPNAHHGTNTTTATTSSTLHFNSWANCYGTGTSGKYDIVNNVPNASTPCYGQYGFANSATSILFSYNHWASSTQNDDVGIGTNSAAGGNPDWTFQYNAASFTVRTLEWWVK
jgi:hypothetical protein